MKLIRIMLAAAAAALLHQAGLGDDLLRILVSACRGLAQVLELAVDAKK